MTESRQMCQTREDKSTKPEKIGEAGQKNKNKFYFCNFALSFPLKSSVFLGLAIHIRLLVN